MKAATGDQHSIVHRMARALVEMLVLSSKGRRSTLALVVILIYLLLGELLAPGFTDYWGFHVAQIAAILVTVLTLETAFHRDGGLSWPTHLLIAVIAAADVLGTSEDLYHTFDLYDKLIHFASGATSAAVTYDILSLLHRRQKITLSSGRRLAAAVMISFLVAGLAWEAYEHYGDVLFGTDRVQSRLDTIHDLISNTCGSMLAASVLWVRESFGRTAHRPAPISNQSYEPPDR